jgi:hypothetical protein
MDRDADQSAPREDWAECRLLPPGPCHEKDSDISSETAPDIREEEIQCIKGSTMRHEGPTQNFGRRCNALAQIAALG